VGPSRAACRGCDGTPHAGGWGFCGPSRVLLVWRFVAHEIRIALVVAERDHALKLRRAIGHLQYLEGSSANTGSKSGAIRRRRARSELGSHFIVTAWANQPRRDPVYLVISECLHNLRSSLLLAYELAAAHTKPLTNEMAGRSEFPVVGDMNSKANPGTAGILAPVKRPSRSSGMNLSAKAIIQGLQPYHLGTLSSRSIACGSSIHGQASRTSAPRPTRPKEAAPDLMHSSTSLIRGGCAA
jgi:hypothetical protein